MSTNARININAHNSHACSICYPRQRVTQQLRDLEEKYALEDAGLPEQCFRRVGKQAVYEHDEAYNASGIRPADSDDWKR